MNPDVIIFTDVAVHGFGRYAGTYRIASELRSHGYIVQVVDFFTEYTTNELKEIIRKFVGRNTLWIGLSNTFLASDIVEDSPTKWWNNPDWKPGTYDPHSKQMQQLARHVGRDDWPELVQLARMLNSNIKIAVGGVKTVSHSIDEEWRKKGFFDYRMVGQGESSALRLTIMLENNRNPPQSILTLPYNDFPLSTIKYTDTDLVFPNESLPMEIARGCVFKCAYCAFDLNGKKLWEFNRQPKLVREDLQEAHDKYGSTSFMFCDDTYNDSVDKVKRFHKEFQKLSYDMTWSSYARLDLIISHWDTAELLYESGARSIFFGVETLNHESGKKIGKGMDPEKIKDGMYRLREKWPDVLVAWGMIIGLPGEDEDTLRKNFEWFLRDDCPVDIVACWPLVIPTDNPYGEDNDHNSKMGNNPMYYGYEIQKDGSWKNEHMDLKHASSLANEYREKFRIKKERKGTMWPRSELFPTQNLMRVKNVGFTYEEMRQGDERINYNEIQRRRLVMKEQYREKLMRL